MQRTNPDRQPQRIRASLIRALIVGLCYQIVLIPIQPLIEPAYVWVEVAIGVFLAFAVADSVVAGEEPAWHAYRIVLMAAFIGLALIIVPFEIVNHIILPSLGVTLPV